MWLREIILRRFPIFVAMFVAAATANGAQLRIAFEEQRVYTTESRITVEFTIHNDGTEPFRFELADDRLQNIRVEVTDRSNQVLPYRQATIDRLTASRTIRYREISIDPGESYTFREPLSEIVALDLPDFYVVRAVFSPSIPSARSGSTEQGDLSRSGFGEPLTSNPLSLFLRPPISTFADDVPTIAASPATPQTYDLVLQPQPISPDEVVNQTLDALKRGQARRFLLYLDLESLYRQDPAADRAFRNAADGQRMALLEAYRDRFLLEEEEEIATVPDRFEVIEVNYKPMRDIGTVWAILEFDEDSYTEVRRYTYEMERRDDIWYIVGYIVEGLGTR